MTWFTKFLIKFFELDKFNFEKIVIKKDVVEDIINFAKVAYPYEFIAFLKGKKLKQDLEIFSLVYQQFQSSKKSASAKINLPITSGVIGSVHSHPGYSNLPSGTDLKFFNKNFGIHLIISYPFFEENIKAYDAKGRKTNFVVR